jgi:hypothetical protein
MAANAAPAVKRLSTALGHAFRSVPYGAAPEYLDHSARNALSADFNTATEVVTTAPDDGVLVRLMDTYLALCVQYSAISGAVHYYRSDQLFAELIDRSSRMRVEKTDLLERWAHQIETTDTSSGSVYPRFQTVSAAYAQQITTTIAAGRRRRAEQARRQASLLGLLRDEYSRRYSPLKPDIAALRAFDPAPGPALALRTEYLVIEFTALLYNEPPAPPENYAAYTRQAPDSRAARARVEKYVPAIAQYLLSLGKKEPLALLQIIKHLRDPMWAVHSRDKKGDPITKGGQPSMSRCELYVLACLMLLAAARGGLLLGGNQAGFTAEEISFFLAPLGHEGADYEYTTDAEDRFRSPSLNVDQTVARTIAFLQIQLFTTTELNADRDYPRLVNYKQSTRISRLWKNAAGLLTRLEGADSDAERLKILSESEPQAQLQAFTDLMTPVTTLGARNTEVHVGSSTTIPSLKSAGIGTVYMTIVYLAVSNGGSRGRSANTSIQMYVEISALPGYLFEVSPAYFADHKFATFLIDVYNATKGAVIFIEFLSTALPFLPVLIEGGFLALLYEIGVSAAASKVGEIAGKIHPLLGIAVEQAAMMLTPRPHLQPKVNTPREIELPSDSKLDGPFGTPYDRGTAPRADAAATAAARGIEPKAPVLVPEPLDSSNTVGPAANPGSKAAASLQSETSGALAEFGGAHNASGSGGNGAPATAPTETPLTTSNSPPRSTAAAAAADAASPVSGPVFIDSSVLIEIAQGTRLGSSLLQQLQTARSAGVDFRIPRPAWSEVLYPAQRATLAKLGLPIDEGVGLASRLAFYFEAIMNGRPFEGLVGWKKTIAGDIVIGAAARARGARVWSIDGSIKPPGGPLYQMGIEPWPPSSPQ